MRIRPGSILTFCLSLGLAFLGTGMPIAAGDAAALTTTLTAADVLSPSDVLFWKQTIRDPGNLNESIVAASAEQPTRVVTIVPDGTRNIYGPEASPDGSKLAYSTVFSGPNSTSTTTIEVLDLASKTTTVVASATDVFAEPTFPFTKFDDPAWSPDGSRIAFTATGRDINQFQIRDVRVVTLTTPPTVVTVADPAEGPASWVPNATPATLTVGAFSTDPAGGGYYLTNLTDLTRVTTGTPIPGGEGAVQPAWSPDGTTLAFYGFQNRIKTLPAGGGTPTVIFTGDKATTSPAWSSDSANVYFVYGYLEQSIEIRSVPGGGGTSQPVIGGPNENTQVSISSTATLPRSATSHDFNGDGRADIAVWRPSNGTWYVRGISTTPFGVSTDKPVPADFNGDGTTDLAVWRPSNGTWYVRGKTPVAFGRSGDVPVAADYTGDGKADISVWRPSNGTWYVRGKTPVAFGRSGDVPVARDFTGDGTAEIAVWRPSNGTWYIRGGATTQFGVAADKPVAADYTGDSKADIAVYRPSNSTWYVRGMPARQFGGSSHKPVPADYNGDGQTEVATWYPPTGRWLMSAVPSVSFGQTGDVPV